MARKAERSGVSKKIPWVSIFVYTARFACFGLLLVGALYGFNRVERFLVRDSRFRFVGPEYGFESPSLDVQGVKYASRPQVLRVFSQDFGRSVYLIPLADRRAQLRELDWIREASISRIWPNHVVVHVEERRPVAFMKVQVDRFSRFAMIDADGKVLQQPANSPFRLPVLAGVSAHETEPVRREKVHRMLYVMKDLGETGERVSELDVEDENNVRVIAKMKDRAVLLWLGNQNFGSRMRGFLRHYPEIQSRMPQVWRFDLRLDDRITVVEDK